MLKKDSKMFNIKLNDLFKLPGNVGIFWKNIEGYYLGCNDMLASICKLHSRHDIEGRSDFDLPMQQAEAATLRQGDAKVIQVSCALQFQYCITQNNQIIK